MTDDFTLRIILTVEAGAALILLAQFLGTLWPHRAWPTKVIIGGVWLVLLYVFTGQFKAFYRDIPFDGFSWLGLLAYTVLLVGLVAFQSRESRTRRGR